MKFGVVLFPESNCGRDVLHVLRTVMKQEVVELWHKDIALPDFSVGDCLVLSDGFASRDNIGSEENTPFSPIINAVIDFANNGGYVLGICNGFQLLCEAGLLPGKLLKNESQKFICKNVHLKTMTNHTAITSQIDPDLVLKIPIAHEQGRYHAEETVVNEMETNEQILFKYCDEHGLINTASNPNGTLANIAGICNKNRNVFGLMPKPERASEAILGNTDGRLLFDSLLTTAKVEMAAG